MTPASRTTSAGRAYLGLQKQARAARRPVDEYLQFYTLECLLARLSASRFAERFVLKGGVLLAAFGERRPTRDVDFLAQDQDNDPEAVLAAMNASAISTAEAAPSQVRVAQITPGQVRPHELALGEVHASEVAPGEPGRREGGG